MLLPYPAKGSIPSNFVRGLCDRLRPRSRHEGYISVMWSRTVACPAIWAEMWWLGRTSLSRHHEPGIGFFYLGRRRWHNLEYSYKHQSYHSYRCGFSTGSGKLELHTAFNKKFLQWAFNLGKIIYTPNQSNPMLKQGVRLSWLEMVLIRDLYHFASVKDLSPFLCPVTSNNTHAPLSIGPFRRLILFSSQRWLQLKNWW